MLIKSDNINLIYLKLCEALKNASKVGNTRELNNVKIVLTDVDDCVVGNRNISIPYLCGELLWYFHGSRDMHFISRFASMWKRISDDGVTSNSAYGYLIKYAHCFDQVEKVIELLTTDPLSRRAVVNINVPNESVIETKDEPCTIALQFMIRNNKLYCTSIMRSNDVWRGFPYDIAFFASLQKYIAHRLNLRCGPLTHFVVSLHVYQNDLDKLELSPDDVAYSIDPIVLSKNASQLYGIIEMSENPKEDIVKLFTKYGILKAKGNK